MKLNLGCNTAYLGDYVNVDINPTIKADLYFDLTQPLPFDSDSTEEVLLSHVLEHLYYEDGKKLLSEIHRILKAGGLLRVSVPNVAFAAKRLLMERPDGIDNPFTFLHLMEMIFGAQNQTVWQLHRSGYTPKMLKKALALFRVIEEEFVYNEIRLRAFK